ncbi:MAG: acyl-CoA dehydrogenase [Terracoccus sp.]
MTSTAVTDATNATADDVVAGLQRVLDGPRAAVRDECRTLSPDVVAPPDGPLEMREHQARVSAQLAELARSPWAAAGFPERQGGTARYGDAVIAFEMLGHTDLSLFVKAGVQWGLFGGAVSLLGTERHYALVPSIISGELQGCFAMTETGHGSDVQGVLTTATHDPATDEIVVHSPSAAARKDYIGNAAVDGRMAAVFARLVVGEDRGVHCVLVPIRHTDGSTCPGVTIEDCGPKIGLGGVDNGRLLFDHVRVPRTNLLGRYGDIDDDGRYTSPIDNPDKRFFTMLGALVRGRISIAGGAGAATRSALTVATRYAAERTQFTAPGSDAETSLLDYRTHQRRLLPRIAHTWALAIAQNELVETMDAMLQQVAGDVDSEAAEVCQRQLETRAAALKVASTRHAADTIQACREACGGAGYLWANRLAALRADTDIFTTFEGDNAVLLQLVAKSMLGDYKATFGDLDTAGTVRFGARLAATSVLERTAMRGLVQRLVDAAPGRDGDDALSSSGAQLRLLRDRETHLLEGLAIRLRQASSKDGDGFSAFNDCQDHLVEAARAHTDRLVAESFVAAVEGCDQPAVAEVLARVCDLHLLSTIEQHRGWYLEHDRLSPARSKAVTALVNERCADLRPDALALVDAFGIPDAWVSTEMLTDVTGFARDRSA